MMPLGNIKPISQEIPSHLSNHIVDTDLYINRDSVLLIENSSGRFIGGKCLEDKSMNVLEESIYMDMCKNVTLISNSYEISYDEKSYSYLFNKSLLIGNKKIILFFILMRKKRNQYLII